jgi:threonine/homoserine/homoserine lactone efflux protein
MVVVFMCYFGLTSLIAIPENQRLMGIMGGLFMFVYGGYLLVSNPSNAQNDRSNVSKQVSRGRGLLVVRGFLLNILNPFTLVYWLGLSTWVSALPTFEQTDDLAFFGGTLSAVLFTDLLKSYLARQLRPWLSLGRIRWLNRITGMVLIGFGISLLIQVFWLKRIFF